jgi:hypothetical protein
MRKIAIVLFAALVLGFGVSTASAVTIGLYDSGFNKDGIYPGPAGINLGGFNTATGLGTITATVIGAGSHYLIAFFDHEIDEALNTFYNEYGAVNGVAAAGQSWEIDEPGYVYGDIYENFKAGALDNSNGVPSSAPDDVSMALGWNFILALDGTETATITFVASTIAPSGFYLKQFDPDSKASIFLSSTLDIEGGGTPQVPEPGTLMLLGLGLLGIVGVRRK